MTAIGILGCGSIGREIALAVQQGKAGDAKIVGLFDQVQGSASLLAKDLGISVIATESIEEFLSIADLEFVVECASPQAVYDYSAKILSAEKDLLVMSSGALVSNDFTDKLYKLAKSLNLRLIIPSGALGGIDAIKAVKHELETVTLTTIKPPRGLKGAPGFKKWEDRQILKSTIIFEGPAMEATKLFPANVNVAATLGLAGLGSLNTIIKIIADPKAKNNTHIVEAVGSMGKLQFIMELEPHPTNPKTSSLAIYSAIQAIQERCNQVIRIGT